MHATPSSSSPHHVSSANWSSGRRRGRRVLTLLIATIFSSALLLRTSAPAQAATNACSNPVLATDLSGWGPLDGASYSRDTVGAGEVSGASHAFDTAGLNFYQPQFAVSPGQTWSLSAVDRVFYTSGTATMSVDWYNASGTYLSTTTGSAVAVPQSNLSSGTWTKVTMTATVPANAATAHVVQTGALGSASGRAFKATACDYELTSAAVPSGVPMPVGDLGIDSQGPNGWNQTFADDFTTAGTATSSGALPDGKWWGYADGTAIGNSSPTAYYKPSQTASVSGGVLKFLLFATGGHGYAAVESPLPTSSQTYGRWNVRYRYESGSGSVPGYKSVWMLWPQDDQWGEGEDDFAEYSNSSTRTAVEANLHRGCGDDVNGCTKDGSSATVNPEAWHTATVVWSPGKVTALNDNTVIGTSTTQVPITAMRLLLQTEASTYGPSAADGSALNIDVDWIVGYTRK